ncbi:MAG: LacI family DNA-binding transcriptional regulator [Opitutaceae bacterium]
MATIYGVAASAGVSPKTAARILAGESPKSKSRKKILDCARKLGYVRNRQAANLRTGRTGLIGVIVPYISNPFYTKYLQELHNVLHASGYEPLIACSFGVADVTLTALRSFAMYNVDGLVLDISEGPLTPAIEGELARFQKGGHAIVVTGGQGHSTPYDHLYLNNRAAIAKVVEHLASRGHRRIGFLGGGPGSLVVKALPGNLNIQNRFEGFKRALRDRRLPMRPHWVSLGDPALPNVSERANRLVRHPDRPSALVCSSDMIAMVAVKAALEGHLKVPEDFAIAGFDDIDQAALLNPSLTTVRQPLATMAAAAVELLLLRLGSPKRPVQERQYEAQLVARASA